MLLAACAAMLAAPALAQDGDKSLSPSSEPPQSSSSVSTESWTENGEDFSELMFSSGGLLVKQKIRKWKEETPDDKCKQDVVFLIDNSGSMSQHRVKMFTAVNVAVATIREKGFGRVSTVVFSDKPATFGPPPPGSRSKNSRPTDKCAFCWRKSNPDEQPFPDPNKVRGGTLTDLAAGIDHALDIMRKDVAGKGPAGDGPRANPERRYRFVMLSDMLQTKGISSPNSPAFHRFAERVFSVTCGEDWKKYVTRDGNGYKLKARYAGKADEMCTGAIAEMHYFLFAHAGTGHKDMSLLSKKVTADNVKGLKALNTAWEETAVANWRRMPGSRKQLQVAMHDLLSGQTNLGGASYHAQSTIMLAPANKPTAFDWSQAEFVQALVGDGCEPIEYTESVVTVDVEPAELPTLELTLDPMSRHFPNAVTKIDPTYTNSLGKDDMSFLSTQLEKFLGDVQELRWTVAGYVENLERQLADFEQAAKTNPSLSKKVSTIKLKVHKAVQAAKLAEATALQEAAKKISFAHTYVGGFASTRGSNPVTNRKLSVKRSQAAYCLLQGALAHVGVTKYSVTVGSFSHHWHCKAILSLIGTPDASCADVAAVTAAGDAWAAAGETQDDKDARALELTQLEDDARRAEIHFQEATAVEAGFKGQCCLAHGGSSCGSTAACPPNSFSDTACQDKAAWQANWSAKEQSLFDAEVAKSAELLTQLHETIKHDPLQGLTKKV